MRSLGEGMVIVPLLGLGLSLGLGGVARAEDVPPLAPPHASSDIDFWWENRAFDDFVWDTGWVPSGSDVQVRFGVTVLGRTQVGLGGTADTSWPDALTIAIPGRPGTGWLSMGYGIEITAKLKIHVTILGTDYDWEGDLPFVDLPSDLLMAQDAAFDPFVLPGADPSEIVVMDDTERVRVLTYDVAGVVGIPGVEGSISLDVAALLQAAYHTDRIDVDAAVLSPAPIVMEGGLTRLDPQAPWGYGPAADYDVLPLGAIDYAGGVTLYPHVTVAIVGFDIIDEDLAMIPVTFDLTTVSSDFLAAPVHVPLPEVAVTPDALTISVEAPGTLAFHNSGEADLDLRAIGWPAPLAGAPPELIVPAGQARMVPIASAPGTPAVMVVASFSTSDPDRPVIDIPVTVLASEDPGTGGSDAGPGALPGEPDGGCGCHTTARRGPGRSAAGMLLAVGVLLGLRRRRRVT